MQKYKLRFKDLNSRGHGSRNTIKKKMQSGFPLPFEDENGRPFWTIDQIEAYEQNELKNSKRYVPSMPSHLAA